MTARVDLFDYDFNTLVQQKGVFCNWQEAIVCSCVHEQPDFSCPLCGGSGFRYLPPKQIKVVSSSFRGEYKHESLGLREPGTAYITPPNDIIMGFHDRLEFFDFRCKMSENISFEFGNTLSSAFYREIKEILCLMDANYVYEENIDFLVCKDKRHIEWINVECHPDTLSVLYYTTPTYLVTDLLHELRATYVERKTPSETFKELPKQYQITREDFTYATT